jgi:hypothetical protein
MLALAACGPAAAQGPAGEDRDIVVTGTSDRRAAGRFVEAVTIDTAGQLARFDAPVCPGILGLPADFAATVANRVRDVARAAGAAVAGSGCTPNILIVVAADGLEAAQALHRLRPRLFEGLAPRQIEALTRGGEAARAWQVIEMRGRDGRKAEAIDAIPSAGGPPRFVKDAHVLQSSLNSRIGLPTRQDLTLSVLLVDLDAVAGRSLRQLADYAAMRTLARTRAPAATAATRRTILALFEPGPAARGLTRWDLAYLKSLYSTERSSSSDLQRLRIARAMRRDSASRERSGH